MTIALIAHDSKKELMVQFCTAYCRILSQHKLVATGTTGKMIAEATGLQVQRFLAGVQGGDQQIASRIACNEVDLLLISRGALISMAVILVVLPAALMLCDWIIRHTTLKWMVPESANAKKSEKE